MVAFSILPSEDVARELAVRLRDRRLAEQLTQEGLAQRSGVPLGTLKKFERTGQVSLLSFIRLAVTLKDEAALGNLLRPRDFQSLEQVLEKPQRKRGRVT